MTKQSIRHFLFEGDLTIKMVYWLAAITILHHVYGAYIYNSAPRFEIAVFFALALIPTVILHRFSKSHAWLRYVYALLVGAFWVFLIGLIEGGFNHVIKIAVWLTGNDPSFLYSPSEYQPPTDVFFEVTGILTVVPALIIISDRARNWFKIRRG